MEALLCRRAVLRGSAARECARRLNLKARRILPLLHVPISTPGSNRNRLRHRGDAAAINLQTRVRTRLALSERNVPKEAADCRTFLIRRVQYRHIGSARVPLRPIKEENKRRGPWGNCVASRHPRASALDRTLTPGGNSCSVLRSRNRMLPHIRRSVQPERLGLSQVVANFGRSNRQTPTRTRPSQPSNCRVGRCQQQPCLRQVGAFG